MDFQVAGVYKILNTYNGKVYIGSAAKLKTRKRDHFNLLKNNKHHSRYLQASWNKYGESCFTFETILYCNIKNLIHYEQLCIDCYKPDYNINKNAGSRLGMFHTAETKAKISKAITGRVLSKETREKISLFHKGRPKTKEHIQKLIKITTGMKRTEESKKKMSDAQISRPWSAARRQAQENKKIIRVDYV